MSKLIRDCNQLFGCTNLYDVLGIEKGASSAQVKKAYYRGSLTVHPDRVSDTDRTVATEKFQVLGKVYSILSDDEKRKIYDDTGSVDDESFVSEDKDWFEYWRILFPKVTVKDIEDFEVKYKGSAEEVEDLRREYVRSEGDMDIMLQCVLCATVDDEQRFRDILEPLISSGELPRFDQFTNEPSSKRLARKRKAEREKKAAEVENKKKKKEDDVVGDESLRDMILARRETRERHANDFFSHLESKYATSGGAASKSSRKRPVSKTSSNSKAKSSQNKKPCKS